MSHLPPDHPRLPKDRIGVLIANLGTPDATDYWSMRRYLSEFLSDRRVIDYPRWLWQPLLQGIILTTRPGRSGKAYQSIWNTERNESPLLTITRSQSERLAQALTARHGEQVVVDFAMRYGNPSTPSRVEALVRQGCRRILFVPLYPQYSAATTATANDAFFRALMAERWMPAARTMAPYFDDPGYIGALAASVRARLDPLPQAPEVLIASYHGLPRRYLTEGDPYHCHCQKTSRLLAQALGPDAPRIVTTFQSRFGPEQWLQPYTVEEVVRLARAGTRRIAVIAPAFATDCIETLEEIQGQIREAFEHAGGEQFTYIPCLNDDPGHIAVLADLIGRNLQGWLAA